MNSARIVVLAIAITAGGFAAYLLSGMGKDAPTAPAVVQIPTADVLVAKVDIGLGETVAPENLQWQTWTDSTASGSFIRKKDRPDAITQLAGSIARIAVHCRRTDPRAEVGQGKRCGIHGSNPAERDASGFD